MVVLAEEVGGRWSGETAQFLQGLAKVRAQSVPWILQERVEAAWIRVGVASWLAAQRVRSRLIDSSGFDLTTVDSDVGSATIVQDRQQSENFESDTESLAGLRKSEATSQVEVELSR